MVTGDGIETRFLALLRQFFTPDQFEVKAGHGGELSAVVAHLTGTIGPNDRTAPYVDTNRLLAPIDGQVIAWRDQDATTVIAGRFEGRECKLTIISPMVVPARAEGSGS